MFWCSKFYFFLSLSGSQECKQMEKGGNYYEFFYHRRMVKPTVATYPSTGGRRETQGSVFQQKKRAGVATNVYSRKMLEKPKGGLRILRIKVRELFTCGEGISTPRVCHKGQRSLIKCTKSWLQHLFIFPFSCVFYLLGSTRAWPLLLRILKCEEVQMP